MRFMMLMIPKGYAKASPDAMPDVKAMEAMMQYNESLRQAGALLAVEGLRPPCTGARVAFAGGKPTVTPGPFPDVEEAVGGYRLIQAASLQEAIDWASRCPASADETIEIRQVQAFEDFPGNVRKAPAEVHEMQPRARPRPC